MHKSLKIRIKLNRSGVRSLLKSPEMESIISEACSAIASKAGSGYKSDTKKGRNRIQGRVVPADHSAYKDNMENNTLLKSL